MVALKMKNRRRSSLANQLQVWEQIFPIILGLIILLSHPICAATSYSIALAPCKSTDNKQALHDAQCGELQLPENPNAQEGRHISVNVLRIPSLNNTNKALFLIAGGPGQASTDMALSMRYALREIQQNFDLVFVDQRGTGESNPLNCEHFNFDISRPISIQTEAQIAHMKECIAGLDADLNFYSTFYAVQDLDAVRRALGYEQINLWGASYGTRVVLEYLRQYPSHSRSAILDGVAPYAIQLPSYTTGDSSLALNNVFKLCESQPDCASAFSNLKDRWLNRLKALKSAPQHVELTHPRTEKVEKLYIDHEILSNWLRMGLYVRDLGPLIPLAIHRAAEGDYTMLYSFSTFTERLADSISVGMQTAVICTEDQQLQHQNTATFKQANQLSKQHSHPVAEKLLFLDSQQDITSICALLPKGHLTKEQFEPIESNTPTLLLSGELDPATPAYWATDASTHLKQSQHIIVKGAHHGVTTLGCIPDLLTQFISTATSEPLPTDCINNIKPKAFFIDTAGPALQTSGKADTVIEHDNKPPKQNNIKKEIEANDSGAEQ